MQPKHLVFLTDYFPITIASGDTFCNRKAEIALLKSYIEHKRPTLLVSPRRYGKTSLALKTINQIGLPYAYIDLFSSVDEQDIENAILKGVSKLIQKMESIPKRALGLANSIFESANFKVILGKIGVSVEISKRRDKPAYHILDILERLEQLSQKTNSPIIIFFDEFQCISEATSNHAIESVLRQVAQLTKTISFVFSGSNRRLLSQLFDNRSRPFYKMCEKISLGRISEEEYTKHIQKAAKKRWQLELSQKILDNIFHYSECHPYYVNQICSRLWEKETPTAEFIDDIWHQYMAEETSSVAAETDLLSKNQRKLLIMLSRIGVTNAPLGQKFIQQVNMSKATINQALSFLEKKDYVFRDENGNVKVLDPLIKHVLAEFEE